MVEPRSPLAHMAAALSEGSGDAVRLAERPFLGQLDVRLAGLPALAAAAAAALGAVLPTVPNTTARGERCSILWLGPDEWLVIVPGDDVAELERRLNALVAHGSGAVVDVSANRTAIELSGPRAREVLETGCSLDLHPRAFATGRCAQTLVGRAQVILEQVGDQPAYRLFVRASFAGYLAAWLLDAAREFRSAPFDSRSSVASRQRSVRATSLNV